MGFDEYHRISQTDELYILFSEEYKLAMIQLAQHQPQQYLRYQNLTCAKGILRIQLALSGWDSSGNRGRKRLIHRRKNCGATAAIKIRQEWRQQAISTPLQRSSRQTWMLCLILSAIWLLKNFLCARGFAQL